MTILTKREVSAINVLHDMVGAMGVPMTKHQVGVLKSLYEHITSHEDENWFERVVRERFPEGTTLEEFRDYLCESQVIKQVFVDHYEMKED